MPHYTAADNERSLMQLNRALLSALRKRNKYARQLAAADEELSTARTAVRRLVQSLAAPPPPREPLCDECQGPLGKQADCLACQEANVLVVGTGNAHHENA